MAGSRAASAREPGQVREEAALSDTARAPRASLAGAEDRRARPRPSSGDGCTVRFFTMSTEVLSELARRWNAGDIEGVLELYHEDVVMTPSPHWPETVQLKGKDAFRKNTEEWLGAWGSVEIEAGEMEAFGDRVVAQGCWISTGRMSGVEGRMPVHMVFTVRDGRIAHLEWFPDHQSAVDSARGA